MEAVVVIPAYNEQATIGGVVSAAKEVPLVSEVLVVCDGCTDETAVRAAAAGARVLNLPVNGGKGTAMMAGAAATQAEVILFIDADLVGLRKQHLIDLLVPVLEDQADMTVGLFSQGRVATDLAQFVAPWLSGQRAIKKPLLEALKTREMAGFSVEVAITACARQQNWRVKEIELPDLTHIMKEEKLGLVKGISARMKMYWEIAKGLAAW
ncbi:MAG TPA: glycosyltransferase [Bacillota bacterium]|nr:glycosyltransferase [Bacillota bacterium]